MRTRDLNGLGLFPAHSFFPADSWKTNLTEISSSFMPFGFLTNLGLQITYSPFQSIRISGKLL
jgi:hypothetical protein